MIAMMVLCFFMMRGHGGAMRCSGCRGEKASDRPRDILNGKYDEEKKEDSARRTQQSPEKNRREVPSNEY
jgi:hypothetical protein